MMARRANARVRVAQYSSGCLIIGAPGGDGLFLAVIPAHLQRGVNSRNVSPMVGWPEVMGLFIVKKQATCIAHPVPYFRARAAVMEKQAVA